MCAISVPAGIDGYNRAIFEADYSKVPQGAQAQDAACPIPGQQAQQP